MAKIEKLENTLNLQWKSKEGRDAAKDNGNNKFLLGGSDLILFQEVSIDGSFTKMANGYPKFSN